MSDPRNVAHNKKVKQEKEHHEPVSADAKAKKLWHEYAHDAHTTGLAFARAAAEKKAAAIKQAAIKVRTACGGCHAFFK